MSNHIPSSPVLLLVFNRPEITRRLLEAVRQFAPPKLYIVADGPRTAVAGEQALCDEVRKVFDEIDWDCKVFKLFRETNMGCDASIINGIDWFFDQEEQGIILEDDCIPARSFYNFCNRLLPEFKDNNEVAMIGGSTYYDLPISKKEQYLLSEFYFTWGWATWSHIWKNIDWSKRYKLEEVKQRLLQAYQNNNAFAQIAYQNIKNAYQQEIPNWDCVFYINNLMLDKKVIIPALNQVSNIGASGTHFKDSQSKILYSKTYELDQEIDFSKPYRNLTENEKSRLIKNYLRKYYNYSLRDYLYLLRIKLWRKFTTLFKGQLKP